MSLAGFETTVSADERPQTYALDRAATGIVLLCVQKLKIFYIFIKNVAYDPVLDEVSYCVAVNFKWGGVSLVMLKQTPYGHAESQCLSVSASESFLEACLESKKYKGLKYVQHF